MKKATLFLLVSLGSSLFFPISKAGNFTVPQNQLQLSCTEPYYKKTRENFMLLDEKYSVCKLSMPLALRERWKGRRTFYFIPRVSMNLYSEASQADKEGKRKSRWLALPALVNLEDDASHRIVASTGYKTLELQNKPSDSLKNLAGGLVPRLVSIEGRVTVCVAPVYRGDLPCVTFEVRGQYNVYNRR
jgi:hypothetical protein